MKWLKLPLLNAVIPISEPLQYSYAAARLLNIFLNEPVKLYSIKLVTCWKLVKSPANLSLEVIFDPLLGWTYGLGS